MNNLALELDLIAAKLDAKGQGVACGGGWISPRAKCSKDKAKTTSKENLAKTTEKRKKAHATKASIKSAANRKQLEASLNAAKPTGKKRINGLMAQLQEMNPGEPRSLSAELAGKAKSMQPGGKKRINDLMGKLKAAPTKARERPTSVGGVSIDSQLPDLELTLNSHASKIHRNGPSR